MKLKIIEERCIACGACQALAPQIFEVWDVAKILKEPKSEVNKQVTNYAIAACPTNAIKLIKQEKKAI